MILEIDTKQETEEVSTLWEASKKVRQYIELRSLGSSRCIGGKVYTDSGEFVARISYNGCIWDTNDEEVYSAYPQEEKERIVAFRKECGDFKSNKYYEGSTL